MFGIWDRFSYFHTSSTCHSCLVVYWSYGEGSQIKFVHSPRYQGPIGFECVFGIGLVVFVMLKRTHNILLRSLLRSGIALQQAIRYARRRPMHEDALSTAVCGVTVVWRQQASSVLDSSSQRLM